MNKNTYLLKNIYRLWGIAGRLTNREGRPLAVPSSVFCDCDPVFGSTELLHTLLACTAQSTSGDQTLENKYYAYNDDGYWYYVFRAPKSYAIWGPVIFEEHSEHEKWLYCKKRGAQKNSLQIPLLNIWRLRELIPFAHGLLFEEYEHIPSFDDEKQTDQFAENIYPQIMEYELINAEYGMEHHSFLDEKRFYKWLIEGTLPTQNENELQEESSSEFNNIIGAAGLMAKSHRKNAEYGAVAGITLATRYAIAAGVQENDAYSLSDVTLQALARAQSVVEISNIMNHALQEFGRLGREAKAHPQQYSLCVEQCRDYIARHIYEKLSLQEIASKIGVHKGYLSRIFSEQMGMTLTDYIMREKVQISCNLLKYSNRSIAIIAEYISLSPQSYFTRVFKKIMNETPAQYRRTHVDKNFIES